MSVFCSKLWIKKTRKPACHSPFSFDDKWSNLWWCHIIYKYIAFIAYLLLTSLLGTDQSICYWPVYLLLTSLLVLSWVACPKRLFPSSHDSGLLSSCPLCNHMTHTCTQSYHKNHHSNITTQFIHI